MCTNRDELDLALGSQTQAIERDYHEQHKLVAGWAATPGASLVRAVADYWKSHRHAPPVPRACIVCQSDRAEEPDLGILESDAMLQWPGLRLLAVNDDQRVPWRNISMGA